MLSSRPPSQATVVNQVCDAEVLKRSEQLSIDRVWKPYFSCYVPAEIPEHVEVIRSLGRRGQTEQHPWLNPIQEPLIALRRGVVEFVNNNKVIRSQYRGVV